MTYTPVSVKRTDANSGRPTGKKGFIVVFRIDDLATFTRAPGSSRVTAFAFKDGKKPIGIYATTTTQNVYHQMAGDKDARGFIHHCDFEHPGDTEALNDFMENNTNVDLGAIQIPCDGVDCKMAGYPGNPLSLSQDNGQDNNSGQKHAVQLVQDYQGAVLCRIAKSLIPATDDLEVNAILGLPSGSAGAGI